MNIYGKNINLLTHKIMVSKNVVKLLSNFIKENPKINVIKNGDSLKDIFSFKKDSPLYFYTIEKFPNIKEKILNLDKITQFTENVNKDLEIELIDFEMEFEKIFRTIFDIQDNFVDENNILKILKIFKYSPKINSIILCGFHDIRKIMELSDLNIVFLVQTLIQNITINEIETLIIDKGDDFYEIESKSSFLNYLEFKTKTVLNMEDIKKYFKGDESFNSYLIDKSINSIINL